MRPFGSVSGGRQPAAGRAGCPGRSAGRGAASMDRMRIAYLDCSTGISGDMTLGALIDAGVDAGAIRAGIDSLGLPDVRKYLGS